MKNDNRITSTNLASILMGSNMAPGMGLSFLWIAAVFGVIGGIVLIIQAYRQRSA